MVAPLNLELIQESLTTRDGLSELAAIVCCFLIGWFVARRVRVGGGRESRVARFGAGSINRLVFPVTTLVLLLVARTIFIRWHPLIFFPVAVPLAIALALIRLCVYTFRNVFGSMFETTSELAVSLAIWGALILYYLSVLQEIQGSLEEAKLPIGKTTVSLMDLGRDAIVVIVAIVASIWVSRAVEKRVMGMSHLDNNLRVVLAKVFRALLIVIGALIALSMVGIDLTILSVFGGALGVGIGLGLQKLASNYIAGFTILLDRSIRVGDMVTVDGRFGVVSKVTARYVVVSSLDGVAAIVPNETLVTTTVLNHSYSGREIKIGVPIQISYDSDLDLAMRLMTEVALTEPRTLRGATTSPLVQVLGFADSGISLELGVWINDPESGQGNLKSALYISIWRAFQAHGIEIPFPRRDVRVVGGSAVRPDDEAPDMSPASNTPS